LKDFVSLVARLPLAHQPGEVWEYSPSVDVLGRVIEVASGQPLDRFLDNRLFKSLGMVDTGFLVPPEKVARLVDPPVGAEMRLGNLCGQRRTTAQKETPAQRRQRMGPGLHARRGGGGRSRALHKSPKVTRVPGRLGIGLTRSRPSPAERPRQRRMAAKRKGSAESAVLFRRQVR